MHTPEAIFGIQLSECCGSPEMVGNFIKGWGFIVLMNDGLVEVSGVKVNVEGAIWFLGVSEG